MAITTRAAHFTSSGQVAAEFRAITWHSYGRRAGVLVSGASGGTSSLLVAQHGTPNMSVDVTAGSAVVKGTEASTQGCYLVEAPTLTTVTISAADPTNPRIDLVVVRIRDQDYASGSPSTNTATIEAVTGTPAASPAIPTIPSNCVVLAQVAVAALAATVVTGNITDLRFNGFATNSAQDNASACLMGGTAVGLSSALPQSPYTGMEHYRTNSGEKYRWNGSAWKFTSRDGDGVWQAFTPTTAGIGSPTLDCSYTRIGDTVHVRYQVTMVGAGTATAILLGTPITAASSVRNKFGYGPVHLDDVAPGTEYMGLIKMESSGDSISIWSASSAGVAAAAWQGTFITFAAGDTFAANVTYRAV